jgi:hypothetical protein
VKDQEVTARDGRGLGHGGQRSVGQRGAVLLGERLGARTIAAHLVVDLVAAFDDEREVLGRLPLSADWAAHGTVPALRRIGRAAPPGLSGMERGERGTLAFPHRAQLLPADVGPRGGQRVDVGGTEERDVDRPACVNPPRMGGFGRCG